MSRRTSGRNTAGGRYRIGCLVPLVLVPLLMLAGCGLAPAVILSAVSVGFTVAKDIVGIDIALAQDTPGKTPIATVVAPAPASPAIVYEPPAPQLPLSSYEPGDGTGHHVLTPPPHWHYAPVTR